MRSLIFEPRRGSYCRGEPRDCDRRFVGRGILDPTNSRSAHDFLFISGREGCGAADSGGNRARPSFCNCTGFVGTSLPPKSTVAFSIYKRRPIDFGAGGRDEYHEHAEAIAEEANLTR
jgi:hypothetical protein